MTVRTASGVGDSDRQRWHPQLAALVDRFPDLADPPLPRLTPGEARALRASRQVPSDRSIHAVEDLDAGGIPSRLYRPGPEPDLPLLVYFHGGGWVTGDLDSHDDLCRALSVAAGVLVLSVAYRLAPEHPHPAALDDAVAATVWAAENRARLGADEGWLAVGGDSAGANLAAVVAHRRPAPLHHQVLIYPVTDCRGGLPSHRENAFAPVLSAEALRWTIDHYLSGGTPPDDPSASPLLVDPARLRDLPPATVVVAGLDPLLDDGTSYAEALSSAGVDTQLLRYDGMPHGFMGMLDWFDDAADALGRIASRLRRAATSPVPARSRPRRADH